MVEYKIERVGKSQHCLQATDTARWEEALQFFSPCLAAVGCAIAVPEVTRYLPHIQVSRLRHVPWSHLSVCVAHVKGSHLTDSPTASSLGWARCGSNAACAGKQPGRRNRL